MDYTPKPPICQTFIAKNPIEKCEKTVRFCSKKYIKVWIILENQEKRFDIVLCIILGELVYLFDPPLRGCLLILAMIAGAGDK
jgi:hypothetical protein